MNAYIEDEIFGTEFVKNFNKDGEEEGTWKVNKIEFIYYVCARRRDMIFIS